MSDRIDLRNGQQISEWATKNGFDIVSFDSDAPRFFGVGFVPSAGPALLFSVEHSFLTSGAQPMVTLKRIVRAASAEDALYQYFREPKERSSGNFEFRVGFTTHAKPGATDCEAIVVAKLSDQ